jgi:hypothetical protein
MPKEINEWSDGEFRLFNDINMPPAAHDDRFVQMLYDIVLFSPQEDYNFREQCRAGLIDRLWYDYGIIFQDEFDWEAYRLNGESDG